MKDEKTLEAAKIYLEKAVEDGLRFKLVTITDIHVYEVEDTISNMIFERIVSGDEFPGYFPPQCTFSESYTTPEIMQTLIFSLTKIAQSRFVKEGKEIVGIKDQFPELIIELEAFANCEKEKAFFHVTRLIQIYSRIIAWQLKNNIELKEPASIISTYKISFKRRFVKELEKKERNAKRKQLAYNEKLTEKITGKTAYYI